MTPGGYAQSSAKIFNGNRVLRKHVNYDSFGKLIYDFYYDSNENLIGGAGPSTHAEAIEQLFYYTGQEWDEGAGIYSYDARWYNPGTGRWLSEDPIGFSAGDANLYRYVGNNPVTYVDPTGHKLAKPFANLPGLGGVPSFNAGLGLPTSSSGKPASPSGHCGSGPSRRRPLPAAAGQDC